MYVAELWRYPVKSMAGERLLKVNLTPLGLDGDRIVHVENARGRVVTAPYSTLKASRSWTAAPGRIRVSPPTSSISSVAGHG